MRVDVFGDDEGSRAIADDSSASRSKDIDVKLHFIRGQKSSMQMSRRRLSGEKKPCTPRGVDGMV